MRKLYISDLDGTLLNQQGEVSEHTKEMLSQYIQQGVAFSINTSRTPATVFHILRGIPLNVPVGMMNGVLVYNPAQKEYIKVHSLSRETAMVVLGIIKLHHLQCFMYTLEQEQLYTYYDSIESRALNKFRNERIMKYDKVFTAVEDLSLCADRGVIYFCLREERRLLEGLCRDLQAVKGVRGMLYEDVYNPEWTYLEIYSDKASKAEAVKEIKEWGCFDYVIGFGDSTNDKPMFEACDETYAVSNAIKEIQQLATGIIPSNQEDGVVRHIGCDLREQMPRQ